MKSKRLRRILLASIILITVIYNGILQAAPDNSVAANIVNAIARVVDISIVNLIMIILGVIVGAIEALSIILGDEIQIQTALPPANRSPEKAEQIYLEVRLDEFQKEESQFIPVEMEQFSLDYMSNGEKYDNIEVAVKKHGRRFVLIGNPGGGKSTTLRHLFCQHARAYLNADFKERRLPLWIDLGLSNAPVDAEKLIQSWLKRYCLPDTLEQYIAQRKLALYLDGLNELPLNKRKERAQKLREFIVQLPDDFPVIITCRVRDYQNDKALNMGDIPVVEVKPLTSEQIQAFISKRIIHRGEPESVADELYKKLQAEKTLLELAENPYYLTILTEIYPKIPTDLNNLFGQYFDRAYENYTQRYTESLGKKKVLVPLLRLKKPVLKKRLKRLAFRMLVYGGGTLVSQKWLNYPMQRLRIGTQTKTDGINLGFLHEDRGKNLRFYHRALHGYFAIELLSEALQKRSRLDRFTKNLYALIQKIGDLGSIASVAVPALIAALKDEDKRTCFYSAEALGKIGDRRAVEPLVVLLSDTDINIQFAVIEALGLLGDKRAINPLINILTHYDRWVYVATVEALGKLGAEQAIKPLIDKLISNERNAQYEVAETLIQIDHPQTIELLLKKLKNDENFGLYDNTHSLIIKILGYSRDPRVVDLLIAELDGDNDQRHGEVATALGRLGDKKAVMPLINTLRKSNSEIVRMNLAWALGELGDKRAIDELILAINDSNDSIREVAAETLGKIGDARAIEPLSHLLNDNIPKVQGAAAIALWKLNSDQRALRWMANNVTDHLSYQSFEMAKILIGEGNAVVELLVESLLNEIEEGKVFSILGILEKIGTSEAFRASQKIRWELRNDFPDIYL